VAVLEKMRSEYVNVKSEILEKLPLGRPEGRK
jgi:hypothetical protein